MTEKELRTKVANWLVKYVGISEGGSGHREILAVFNDSKLCPRYKMTVNDAWCATSVSAAFIACGLKSIFPCVECSCTAMIRLAKNAGIWVEDDAYTPKIGDVIMYDWDDNGVGQDYGDPEHTGVIYAVNGSTITVIEGNKHNTVGYRTIQVNGRYIRGYVTPKFHTVATAPSSTSSSSTSTTTTTKPSTSTTLKYGVDDIVEFTGTKHYASSNDTSAKTCKAGQATVTATSKDAKHPYHLIAVNGKGSTVYGWINASDIKGKVTNGTNSTASTTKVDYATSYSKSIIGTYKTTDLLRLRTGASTNKAILCVMPKGSKVSNYGYYSTYNGTKWYYVTYKDENGTFYLGFCSSDYLKKM